MSYPVTDHAALANALDIHDGDLVLDVGGGHSPVAFADVVVDIDFSSGHHRDGRHINLENHKHQYIQADIQDLPFSDKAFDTVICVQVLEHVFDPAKACKELMRVGRRGFIEVPRKWTELYAGHPSHRWLIDEIDGVLCFEAIRYNAHPFFNFALPPVWSSPELAEKALISYRRIPCIQMQWVGQFDYRILSTDINPAGDSIDQAERHYNFARNMLHWMVVPEHGIHHARRAINLMPDHRPAQKLYHFYLMVSGRWNEAGANHISLKLAGSGLLAFCLFSLSKLLEKLYNRICSHVLKS